MRREKGRGKEVGAFPLAGAGGQLAEKVGAKIIEIQAARDIRHVVEKAAEAVDIIAPRLQENFADLRRVHGVASRAWESRLIGQSSILTNYYESLIGEEQRLEYLLNLIIDYQSAPARLRWRAALARANDQPDLAARLEASVPQEQADQLKRLKESDSGLGPIDGVAKDVAPGLEVRQQLLINLLNAQRKEIAVLDPKYQPVMAELNKVRETRVTGDRTLEKGGEAIVAWQKAHHSLQAAAEGDQSRPSVAELLAITKEIAALLQ